MRSDTITMETEIAELAAEVERLEAEEAALQETVRHDQEMFDIQRAAYKRAAAQWQAERGDTAVFPDLAELLVWDAERQAEVVALREENQALRTEQLLAELAPDMAR